MLAALESPEKARELLTKAQDEVLADSEVLNSDYNPFGVSMIPSRLPSVRFGSGSMWNFQHEVSFSVETIA